MRIRPLFFAAVLVPVLIGAAAAPAPAATKPAAIRVAPADEYFGRLKMSILGIRNQLRDLGLRLQYAPDNGGAVLGAAAFVEDALHDWEHKYPADPWLAKNVFQLTEIYARVHSDQGQHSAARAFHWLLARYGKTAYAAQARVELASTLK